MFHVEQWEPFTRTLRIIVQERPERAAEGDWMTKQQAWEELVAAKAARERLQRDIDWLTTEPKKAEPLKAQMPVAQAAFVAAMQAFDQACADAAAAGEESALARRRRLRAEEAAHG